jgi:putative transposase
MTHPYPPHRPDFPYIGKLHYFLTFCTKERRSVFADTGAVDLVRGQILRAAAEQDFAVCAYCFMPDHLHVVVSGLKESADCRGFIKAAKQYSGFHFKRQYDQQLWQRYGFERVIRDDLELALHDRLRRGQSGSSRTRHPADGLPAPGVDVLLRR